MNQTLHIKKIIQKAGRIVAPGFFASRVLEKCLDEASAWFDRSAVSFLPMVSDLSFGLR